MDKRPLIPVVLTIAGTIYGTHDPEIPHRELAKIGQPSKALTQVSTSYVDVSSFTWR
jgi:hypothetical protein